MTSAPVEMITFCMGVLLEVDCRRPLKGCGAWAQGKMPTEAEFDKMVKIACGMRYGA